jgi:hypothetical protein
MVIGAMSCGGCGGVGDASEGGGGGGGRVVSSLTNNLKFCSFLWASPGVDEAISHPSKPGLEYQQKTRLKPAFNRLI